VVGFSSATFSTFADFLAAGADLGFSSAGAVLTTFAGFLAVLALGLTLSASLAS
jgi:hypothetical protein